MWFEVPSIEIHQRVPGRVVTRSEKNWQTKFVQLHHIGQTNPLEAIVMKVGL
jgi:hypothetical protein